MKLAYQHERASSIKETLNKARLTALYSVSLEPVYKKPPVQDLSHTGGFCIIVLVSGFPETP